MGTLEARDAITATARIQQLIGAPSAAGAKALGVSLLLLALAGCGEKRGPTTSPVSGPGGGRAARSALFKEVALQAGIRFRHDNGQRGRYYFIESTPAGAALFDYDNDGLLDILLVQSGQSDPAGAGAPRPHSALYHNEGGMKFTDVTAGSGLDKDLGYGHGAAAADYDNDGYEDLFVTAFGENHLLHNEHGSGRFSDVTGRMGLEAVHSTGYATSAAFGDYDNDGRLDLYICYYCPWSWAVDKPCNDANGRPDYCSPQLYDPDVHQLFHNDGNRFTDVSRQAGITRKRGRGLAVAFLDFDEDGDQDIFVANDLSPNMLWRNNGRGRFTDVAGPAGVEYAEGGQAMAAMGIGIADYDHSGRQSLFVTNFSGMPNTLFRNLGGGVFQDASAVSGVALPHMRYLSFGCEFLDYDADGWADLLVGDGHVQVHADTKFEGVTYREPKQLFRNLGNGAFREVTDSASLGELKAPTVTRGLAVGDLDNDGRLDAVACNQNDPVQVFHNQTAVQTPANHWVAFKTVGTRSNRDGRHAVITVRAAGGRQTAVVRAGSSYLSTSDRRVYFGLGRSARIHKVEIAWPSGVKETLSAVSGDRILVVREGRGIEGGAASRPMTGEPAAAARRTRGGAR